MACLLHRTLLHFSISHGDKADSTIILTADGEWIWQATKRFWHYEGVLKRAQRAGEFGSKTCVHEAQPCLMAQYTRNKYPHAIVSSHSTCIANALQSNGVL